MSCRIALVIAYDGTEYAGWQRQTNALSIQQVLEETIERLFHETVHLTASGRTDAGVHAEGQVAAFDLQHPVPEQRLMAALNANLPSAIRVLQCRQVPDSFQPRYDAKKKTYRYTVFNGEVMPPAYRFTTVREYRQIDWDLVERAVHLFEGEHDFAAFHSTGSADRTTVRTIYQASCCADPADPRLHRIELTGNGFLYNMVRIIVSTLLDIGAGKRQISVIEEAFRTGDRSLAGPTAPPQGLTLVSVIYPQEKTL